MDALLTLVLDSIDEQLAVLDRDGNIIYCNQAWNDFGSRNGMHAGYDWRGKNYLEACEASAAGGDADAIATRRGMLAVIKGDVSFFVHEYPCHSPTQKRWFEMRFAPLRGDANHFVSVHHNITARKLSEERIGELNIKLRELSLTDSMTGLANRMRLDAALGEGIQRADRYGKSFSVILFDIDFFKKINDTHGHQAGDAALVRVAKIITETCRRSDVAGRWGGDEFLIILPESSLEAAAIDAEKLRSAIGRSANAASQSADPFTCSFGVAAFKLGDTSDALVGRADAALYKAKDHGRNRVEIQP